MTPIETLIQNAAAMARSQTVGENIVLCRAIDRLFYVDPRDQTIAPHLMMNGLWEPNVTVAIAKHVKRGMHCLDIGANVGYFSILMASSGALVDAFEPNPVLARLINMSSELNGYQALINVHEKAVCERNATDIPLHISYSHNGHSNITPTSAVTGFVTYPCDTVELDSFDMLSKVDFVKCDVEGAEVLVWAGMQRLWAGNPQMQGCFESIGHQTHRAQLYDVLSSSGANWVGVINPVGNVVPIDRDTVVNSTGFDMLWVRHKS